MHNLSNSFPRALAPLLASALLATTASAQPAPAPTPEQRAQRGARPMLFDNLSRPLRYTPDNGDFVIVNGDEFFNRSIYGGPSPFRVDAGDRPEFTLYLPGRGGNLRLGLSTAKATRWLHRADKIVARYRPGSMIYEISDASFGPGTIHIVLLSPRVAEGLVARVEARGFTQPVELFAAFGGINGVRGGRDGDIGTEREPVREFFRLKPDFCLENVFTIEADTFIAKAKAGVIGGILPPGAKLHQAPAESWDDPAAILQPASATPERPVVVGRVMIKNAKPVFIALQNLASGKNAAEVLEIYQKVAEAEAPSSSAANAAPWRRADLPALFASEEAERKAVAERVVVKTPDPFINAAVGALNIAADAVWDPRQSGFVHGGVAWRVRLLGWRVGYAGDTLGWHDRTRTHFDSYAARQDTSPIPQKFPPINADDNLARHEDALHSNGDMTRSHYDMNMVGVDTFFRHLLWTGDLDYARRQWPVIERHLAWERRLFRREFGPEKLPLYEAYACIWASDDLAYNGGGATHSTAYNLYHNRMAARIAKRLGLDASLYEREADLIARGMRQQLWLPDRGWFAEWKDLIGDQIVHPQAAAWTFYHTVDSEVPTPVQAWQMTRQVENELPRFDIAGPGVPEGNYTIATTNWMPFTWSLNNVVFGESVHTALGLWQANRTETAFPLLKGAILDSMYLGICPGNVGMATWFDVNRRESQRDFADGVGIFARSVFEGLFGITPDLIDGEIKVRPGFPAAWNDASLHHPAFDFAFKREREVERFKLTSRLDKPVALRLQVSALRDTIASVKVNGRPATWRVMDDSVGTPRVEIVGPASASHDVQITWSGRPPAPAPAPAVVKHGDTFSATVGANIVQLEDPQGSLRDAKPSGESFSGVASGLVGHRTLFAQVSQGALRWWQPVTFEIRTAHETPRVVFTTDWSKPVGAGARLDPVALTGTFNDRVSQIYRNDYLAPRSPFVSLAIPKHGFGSWCKPMQQFDVDDSGLRALAARNDNRILLPNGVPLATPGDAAAPNIAFVSVWDRFPREISTPLTGKASKIYLLMAGSTMAMQSRKDNGEVIVTYTDGTTTRLGLENPTTWWPVDEDFFIDDMAFKRPGPLPVRIDLKTGNIRVLEENAFKGRGRVVPGGAGTVLDLSLDPSKELKSLTVRAIVNEVIIGLMSATLQRP